MPGRPDAWETRGQALEGGGSTASTVTGGQEACWVEKWSPNMGSCPKDLMGVLGPGAFFFLSFFFASFISFCFPPAFFRELTTSHQTLQGPHERGP